MSYSWRRATLLALSGVLLGGCPDAPLREPPLVVSPTLVKDGATTLQATLNVRFLAREAAGARSGPSATVGFLAWTTDGAGETVVEPLAGNGWTYPGGRPAAFAHTAELRADERLSIEAIVHVRSQGSNWQARVRRDYFPGHAPEVDETITFVFPDDFQEGW